MSARPRRESRKPKKRAAARAGAARAKDPRARKRARKSAGFRDSGGGRRVKSSIALALEKLASGRSATRRGGKRAPSVIVVSQQPGDPEPTEVVLQARETGILPIRRTVLFPFAILPINVGRPRSRQLLNDVMAADRVVAVFTQKDATQDDVEPADLHAVGTLATVLRMVRVSDEQISIVLQGLARVKIAEPLGSVPYLRARVEPLAEVSSGDVETEALAQTILATFERIVALSPQLPNEAVLAARNQGAPARLADFVASLFDLPTEEKQGLLETLDVKQRLKTLNQILARQQQVLEVGAQIQESVRESIDQRQKEYVLRQQLEAIEKELGEG
ncbi:MAG TPA: LON peptidase substrate-binding domain-containing protein, partial [Dongiaceae bacterium]|nr:LON peptidase substrate-binding domain-containing protein [Dongiaceae bacterium]